MTDNVAPLCETAQREIDLIIRACAPLDWKDGDYHEAKEATGCMHPYESLGMGYNNRVYCKECETQLHNEAVAIRIEQHRATQ